MLLLLWLLLLLLRRRHAQDGRVLADVVDERGEGGVAEEGLDQAAVTLVLLHQGVVFLAKVVAFLGFHGHFAFQLADVF